MAATRIRLTDGEDIIVDAEFPELMKAFRGALRAGRALEIRNEDGKTVAFNPSTILYFVEDGAADTNGAAPLRTS